jgi:hypothetical protein
MNSEMISLLIKLQSFQPPNQERVKWNKMTPIIPLCMNQVLVA